MEKTTEIYFIVILKAVINKEGIEKMLEIWIESTTFNATSQRLTD